MKFVQALLGQLILVQGGMVVKVACIIAELVFILVFISLGRNSCTIPCS